MTPLVFITGGAGFIGTHTARLLVGRGWRVRVLDNLCPQVHGPGAGPPKDLPAEVEFIQADVTDRDAVRSALDGVTAVLHLASLTGVIQSMHELESYAHTNVTGTACIWDVIAGDRIRLDHFVLASTRAVYGEGAYQCPCQNGIVHPPPRSLDQLRRGQWGLLCGTCGKPMKPIPTSEDIIPSALSVYALTKVFQEQLCRQMADLTGTPLVTLRYFNVYGPNQALRNPYTGIAPVFCTQLMQGHPATLFEDGLATRDFIHVQDVAMANWLALNYRGNRPAVFNIGSGQPATIEDLARAISLGLGVPHRVEHTGQYRVGDIRSCYASTSRAAKELGFRAAIGLEEGVSDLVDWVSGQALPRGAIESATADLAERGLIRAVVPIEG